jgi:hypothetical protein
MGDVLILLPGTTGTVLVDQGQKPTLLNPAVWPWQALTAAALGQQQRALNLLEGSDPPEYPPIYPYQIQTQTLLFAPNAYSTFISSFASDGWTAIYTTPPQQTDVPPENQPGIWGLQDPLPSLALITFPYDWRQDNATTALWFRSFLSAVVAASGGTCTITLVGHSMGGLVARAYLETVGKDDPLTNNIQRLITLGTPHLGAPLALDAITDNFVDLNQLGLPASMDTVVWEFVNSSYDSTYELLPPPQTPFLTDEGALKSIFPLSALSPALQQYLTSNGFSTDDAQQASTFLSSLGYTGQVPYYCAYGSGLSTAVSFAFSSGSLTEQDLDAGDSIVPMTSAMFAATIPTSQTFNAGAVAHGLLPGNGDVIAQVKTWMQTTT